MGVEGVLKAVGKVLDSERISARPVVLSGQVITSVSSSVVCNGCWCWQRAPAVSEKSLSLKYMVLLLPVLVLVVGMCSPV